MAKRKLVSSGEAQFYGFDWPPHPGIVKIPGMEKNAGAHIQVLRTASIDRSNGLYRVFQVTTERDQINVYVSPTGKIRIFTDNKEWSL
jgi:hypothetical protein